MRNKMFQIIAMLLFFMTPSLFAGGQRTVHISLVKKGTVQQFYNRLVTPNHHLVITDQKPGNTYQHEKISLNEDEQLFVIESHGNLPKVEKAIKQWLIGDFLIVVVKSDDAKHLHFSSVKVYSEPLSDSLKTAKIWPATDKLIITDTKRRRLDIDPVYLKDMLDQFSGASGTVIDGESERITERGTTSGRAKAVAWLQERYEELGFTVSTQEYSSGRNMIAERQGTDTSKYLIISAHLDSVRNAGADDDGAGTISALAIANALKDVNLKYNLRIVGFDQEENGLIGSSAYARHLSSTGEIEGLQGVFNLEMTGYDSNNDGAIHIIDCNENTSADLTAIVEQAIRNNNFDLQKIDACTNRSDHAAFWRYNRPAIVISQNFFGWPSDSNPCYHKTCDKTDILNFDYMSKITEAVAVAIHSMIAE